MAMAGQPWCRHACGRRRCLSSRYGIQNNRSCVRIYLPHVLLFICSALSTTHRVLLYPEECAFGVHQYICAVPLQTLMDIESLNEFMFPFLSACLLEQRSPHTRVAFARLQSRGWLAALCAPREVGRQAGVIAIGVAVLVTTLTTPSLPQSSAATAADRSIGCRRGLHPHSAGAMCNNTS